MLQGCITFSPSPSLWAVSRWREITRDGGFPVFLLFLSLHTLFLCFLFLFFISATVAFLSSFHLFFFSLTLWAATLCYCHMSECQPPHHSSLWLAGPFQVGELLPDNNLVWLLEQRCNWLICSPCLGLCFWRSPVCGCVLKQGWWWWLLHRVLDKHTCTCAHAYLHSLWRIKDLNTHLPTLLW